MGEMVSGSSRYHRKSRNHLSRTIKIRLSWAKITKWIEAQRDEMTRN
jgi:hypothetical protein